MNDDIKFYLTSTRVPVSITRDDLAGFAALLYNEAFLVDNVQKSEDEVIYEAMDILGLED